LGELPLEIDGKAVAAAKSDDPDLAGAEQRFCERIDLGLRDAPESPVEIFLALREMGVVPVAAGLAAGIAEKQARTVWLSSRASHPACS
jgi:hypothetical protein